MYTEQYYETLTSSDSGIILGFVVVTLAITLTSPKIIKIMQQKKEFDAQRFQQEMERHRLLIDVVKDNTRINAELKSALEGYTQITTSTLKNDREMFQTSLERIREKIDLKDFQNTEILSKLDKIMLVLDRKGT